MTGGLGAAAEPNGAGENRKAPLEYFADDLSVDPKMKDKVGNRSPPPPPSPIGNDAVLGYINYFQPRTQNPPQPVAAFGPPAPDDPAHPEEEGIPQEIIHWRRPNPALSRAVSRPPPAACGTSNGAARYGLKQTPLTRRRMDPEKATRAAPNHLRDLYHKFRRLVLAIAA